MFGSEPFFLEVSPYQSKQHCPLGFRKTFLISFLKHLSNEQFCSSQMLSEWPLKAQLNLIKVTPSRKTGMRIGISRRAQERCRSFSRQRSRCGPRQTYEIWQRWAWMGSGLSLSRWIHPQTPRGCPKPWVVLNPKYTIFFPVCTYLWCSIIYWLRTIRLTTITNHKIGQL